MYILCFHFRICSKFFLFRQVCYFVNSGSEANDMAIMMARAHTGNFDFLSLR